MVINTSEKKGFINEDKVLLQNCTSDLVKEPEIKEKLNDDWPISIDRFPEDIRQGWKEIHEPRMEKFEAYIGDFNSRVERYKNIKERLVSLRGNMESYGLSDEGEAQAQNLAEEINQDYLFIKRMHSMPSFIPELVLKKYIKLNYKLDYRAIEDLSYRQILDLMETNLVDKINNLRQPNIDSDTLFSDEFSNTDYREMDKKLDNFIDKYRQKYFNHRVIELLREKRKDKKNRQSSWSNMEGFYDKFWNETVGYNDYHDPDFLHRDSRNYDRDNGKIKIIAVLNEKIEKYLNENRNSINTFAKRGENLIVGMKYCQYIQDEEIDLLSLTSETTKLLNKLYDSINRDFCKDNGINLPRIGIQFIYNHDYGTTTTYEALMQELDEKYLDGIKSFIERSKHSDRLLYMGTYQNYPEVITDGWLLSRREQLIKKGRDYTLYFNKENIELDEVSFNRNYLHTGAYYQGHALVISERMALSRYPFYECDGIHLFNSDYDIRENSASLYNLKHDNPEIGFKLDIFNDAVIHLVDYDLWNQFLKQRYLDRFGLTGNEEEDKKNPTYTLFQDWGSKHLIFLTKNESLALSSEDFVLLKNTGEAEVIDDSKIKIKMRRLEEGINFVARYPLYLGLRGDYPRHKQSFVFNAVVIE